MSLKGKRVMIVRGPQQWAYGIVTHADRDSLRIVTDDGLEIYDRIENIKRAKEDEHGYY